MAKMEEFAPAIEFAGKTKIEVFYDSNGKRSYEERDETLTKTFKVKATSKIVVMPLADADHSLYTAAVFGNYNHEDKFDLPLDLCGIKVYKASDYKTAAKETLDNLNNKGKKAWENAKKEKDEQKDNKTIIVRGNYAALVFEQNDSGMHLRGFCECKTKAFSTEFSVAPNYELIKTLDSSTTSSSST